MQPLLNIKLIKQMAVDAERIANNISDSEWKRAYQKVAEGCGLLWRKLEQAVINKEKSK